MIFTALIQGLVAVVTGVLDVFPDFTAPDTGALATAVEWVADFLQAIAPWVNLPLLFAAIAIVVGARAVLLLAEAGLWIYHLVRG